MMNDPYTHKPEHIVQVFNDIDSGKYPNVSFSHANVAMISKDVYYQMCYELEELRKASSMALKSLEEAAQCPVWPNTLKTAAKVSESIAALRWALYEEDENDCSTTD
jgi:hypothetical protein